jgi:hypothetical protein
MPSKKKAIHHQLAKRRRWRLMRRNGAIYPEIHESDHTHTHCSRQQIKQRHNNNMESFLAN